MRVSARKDVGMTANPQALMDEGAARILEGVEEHAAAWVLRAVTFILDAWGRLDTSEYVAAIAHARDAGAEGAERVVAELRAFFGTDVDDQRTTPLAIVRSLRIEATNVLKAAGVPAVERDRYEEQSFPDDIYGIVPKDLGELGDEDLGAALVAWGLGKSGVLRARRPPEQGVES
jgi:hypothetical protein